MPDNHVNPAELTSFEKRHLRDAFEIIRKMQKVMYDKAYVIPMYARLNVSASTKRVLGLNPGPTTDQVWNSYEWDVQ